jgi:hypothetical protein
VFNFTFSLQGSRLPPTVRIFQDIKNSGVLDLKCEYKIGVSIYETSNRVDKIAKVECPVVIKEAFPKSMRRNFIEMGQSEVLSCLAGLGTSGGICSFQVRVDKDHFLEDETIRILAKIDNSRSKQPVSRVEVRLVRFIRLHTQ